jgi:phosphate:Na+ symporter
LKNRIFKKEEMDELAPFIKQVGEALGLLQEKLGQGATISTAIQAKILETNINKTRKKLQKLIRKRIEAGKDVRTELIFIDIVRRIEKLGDYCSNITDKLSF